MVFRDLEVLAELISSGNEEEVDARFAMAEKLHTHTLTLLLMEFDKCGYIGYSRMSIYSTKGNGEHRHYSHKSLLRWYRAFMQSYVMRIGEDELRSHYKGKVRDYIRTKQGSMKKILPMVEKLVRGWTNRPRYADYLSGMIAGCKGPDVLKGLYKGEKATMEQIRTSHIFVTVVAEEYYSVFEDSVVKVDCVRCRECTMWLILRMWFASYTWLVAMGAMRDPDVQERMNRMVNDIGYTT
jgi:hypothetical protein